MGHVEIPLLQGRTIAVEDVDRRDRPSLRKIGGVHQFVLGHLATLRLELIAYPPQGREDSLTQRLHRAFLEKYPLYGLEDQSAANLIRQDRTHILIDLAGHTSGNRPPVFACKPTPLQVHRR